MPDKSARARGDGQQKRTQLASGGVKRGFPMRLDEPTDKALQRLRQAYSTPSVKVGDVEASRRAIRIADGLLGVGEGLTDVARLEALALRLSDLKSGMADARDAIARGGAVDAALLERLAELLGEAPREVQVGTGT